MSFAVTQTVSVRSAGAAHGLCADDIMSSREHELRITLRGPRAQESTRVVKMEVREHYDVDLFWAHPELREVR